MNQPYYLIGTVCLLFRRITGWSHMNMEYMRGNRESWNNAIRLGKREFRRTTKVKNRK